MTLQGGAHVSIGGYHYLLDEGTEGHYQHNIPTLLSREQALQGAQDKATSRTQRMRWVISDWSGGEGNRIFYDDQPNTYDYGIGTNSRTPGQFGPRPKRDLSRITITATDATTKAHYLRFWQAYGKVWAFVDRKVVYGTGAYDGWTLANPGLPTDHFITAACGDSENIYMSSWKDGGDVANDRLLFYSPDGGTTYRNMMVTEALSAASTVTASAYAFSDMVVHNGRLYAWTGRRLWAYDVANLTTTNHLTTDQFRKVYDTGTDPRTKVSGFSWWSGMVDCGTAMAFFTATPGKSMVYLFKQGVVRPIWTKPGFTCKNIVYNSGMIYLTGTFIAGTGSGSTGHGVIYAIPLNNLTEILLKKVRWTIDFNLQMQIAGPSVGNQVMFGAGWTGRSWVYDLDYNGFTMLDHLTSLDGRTAELTNENGSALEFTANDHRMSDMIHHGKYRLVGIYRPTTAGETFAQVLHYDTDRDGSRMTTATSANWFNMSPENDYGYPDQLKALTGIFLSFRPESESTTSGLLANQRIIVKYAMDKGPGDDATWTTAATITSATTPRNGTRGQVFIDLSASTLKFSRIRFQVFTDNNGTAGVKPPIIYVYTPEAELLDYDETWDLILRIKDEQPKTRPSKRAAKGNILRDTLITARKARDIVAFVDGYIYREDGREAASVQVVIDDLLDTVDHNGEGVMKVRLRAVGP